MHSDSNGSNGSPQAEKCHQGMSLPIPPVVILVRPQLVENIGMVARAMANCSLCELRVVAPRDPWPLGAFHQNRMRAAASGADSILDAAQAFESLQAASADLTLLYATTARTHDMTGTISTARVAAHSMLENTAQGHRIGVVFGPERTGLWCDDLAHAAQRITIPLNPGFTSLNLAQAVLLVGYEWYTAAISETVAPQENVFYSGKSPMATRADYDAFLARLDGLLDAAGFFPTPHMRPTVRRNLHLSITRAPMTAQEIRTWHGVLTALTNPHGKSQGMV